MNEQFEEDLSDLVHPYKVAIQDALEDNEAPDTAIEEAEYIMRDLSLLVVVIGSAINSFYVAKEKKTDGAELLYNYLSNMKGIIGHEIDCIRNAITDATAPDHNPDAPCKADKGVK
jgi:hypothetical protein